MKKLKEPPHAITFMFHDEEFEGIQVGNNVNLYCAGKLVGTVNEVDLSPIYAHENLTPKEEQERESFFDNQAQKLYDWLEQKWFQKAD